MQASEAAFRPFIKFTDNELAFIVNSLSSVLPDIGPYIETELNKQMQAMLIELIKNEYLWRRKA